MSANFLDKKFGRLGNRMFQMAYIYAQFREQKIPDIYVQNYNYFKKYKDELREAFGIEINYNAHVSIHVRRGDYVNNGFYVNLMQTDYYIRAMQEFSNQIFIIFSDDLKWCQEQEIFKDCHFSTGNDEIADFQYMVGCQGHIIANSSFSFWSAYLGQGKVVAPSVKNWYTDGVERTVCPPEWIRI